MRDSLALALVRAERCRATAARWAAPTDPDGGNIGAGLALLVALLPRAYGRLRRKLERRASARQAAT